MYRYYCTKQPKGLCAVPYIEDAHMDGETFREARYIPEIDCMAWGWVEYDTPLTPAVIAQFKLIAAPREDE